MLVYKSENQCPVDISLCLAIVREHITMLPITARHTEEQDLTPRKFENYSFNRSFALSGVDG